MAEFTHHVDVMLRTPEIGREIHTRLVTAVHRIITNEKTELAVAWPDWKYQFGEFGFLFRVFGTPKALETFSAMVQPMADRRLIRVYPAQEVPPTVDTVAYVRDRLIEKRTDAFVARQRRRDERQGRARPDWNGKPATPSQQRHSHALTLQSASTGQQFSLFVRAAPRAGDGEAGRNYGLGYTLPSF